MAFADLKFISFLKDGAQAYVSKDTVTPANSVPLPVELTGATGVVAVNAANLNVEVQTTGYGANPDSMRITDGVDELAINPDGSIPVSVIDTSLAFPPTINNIAIPLANTEQSFVIPSGTRQIELYERSGSRIKYAFIVGQSATNYVTIDPGTFKVISGFTASTATTIYFQATKASGTLELVLWS